MLVSGLTEITPRHRHHDKQMRLLRSLSAALALLLAAGTLPADAQGSLLGLPWFGGERPVPQPTATPNIQPLLATPAPRNPRQSEMRLEHGLLLEQWKAVQKRVRTAEAMAVDIALPAARQQLFAARSSLEQGALLLDQDAPAADVQERFDAFRTHLKGVRLALMPSRTVETRGMLLDADAIPADEAGVRRLVQELDAAGFNLLVPEVVRRGYAVHVSRILARDATFRDKPDVLAIMIDEAHRCGMAVMPWVWSFRVRSYDETRDFGNPVLGLLPGLASRTEQTQKPRFLSPALPGARAYMRTVLKELVDNHDIDGLLLDYIRYDEETPDDDASRTQFRLERLGLARPSTFMAPTPSGLGDEARRRDYQLWREAQVSQFVADIGQLCRNRRRPIPLAVSTFRGEAYARLRKLQNWRHWADNGWTQVTTSMLYTSNLADLRRWIKQETDQGRRTAEFLPILGLHRMDDTLGDTLEQIQFIRDENLSGVLFFSLGHTPRGLLADLALGPFRNRAVLPLTQPRKASEAVLAELDRGYLKGFPLARLGSGDWITGATLRVMRTEVAALRRSAGKLSPSVLAARVKSLAEALEGLERVHPALTRDVRQRLADAGLLLAAQQGRDLRRRYVPLGEPPMESANRLAPQLPVMPPAKPVGRLDKPAPAMTLGPPVPRDLLAYGPPVPRRPERLR